MNKETFFRHVRHVLTHLYDPTILQTHPLLDVLDLAPSVSGSLGESLRHAVWQAIEDLKPVDSVPTDQPGWASYRLLSLHYIEAMTVEQTCSTLALSPRSFRRHQKAAIDAVASLLWEKAQSQPKPAPEQHQEGDLAGARQFAMTASLELCRIQDIVRDVQDTVQPLAKEMGVTLNFAGADDLVRGGPALLAQIVVNILLGILSAARDAELEVESWRAENTLVWRLGPLDAEALASRLAYSQELQVGRVLLDASGGSLSVENAGSLASLALHIPIPDPQIVLTVDDDPETTQLYARYLGRAYTVDQANSVAQAQDSLAHRRPDVILLDVLMPQQDGWKLLRSLRREASQDRIPIIVCSVLSQPSLAFAQGADRVMQKPISPADLHETIRELLSQANSQPRQRPASPSTG